MKSTDDIQKGKIKGETNGLRSTALPVQHDE